MKYKKIESIKRIKNYHLPHPETIFIFKFDEQEKEIDSFLKDKKIVTIRTDKKGYSDFLPCYLRCPKSKVKEKIKELSAKNYAVILQNYIPIRKDRKVSGNILILKKDILVELMGKGPLTWLNREGKIEERLRLKKNNLKEIEHFGKRLIKKRELADILKLVKNIKPYKVLEFSLSSGVPYFWQIKDDKTAKKLDK